MLGHFTKTAVMLDMLAQIAAIADSTIPNMGSGGAIAAVMGAFSGYLSA